MDFGFNEFLTLLGAILTLEIVRFYYKYLTRPNPLPGPIPLPYIGNLLQILYTNFQAGIYRLDFGEYAGLQVEKYGRLSEVYLGNERAIYLSRAEDLEKPYLPKTDTKCFRRMISEGTKEFGLNGLVLNNEYQSWKRNRKFVTQLLMSPKFLRGFTITVQKFFESGGSGRNLNDDHEMILNLSDWVKCFTTDIAISTAVGEISSCFSTSDLKESEWTKDMKESRDILKAVRLFLESLKFFGFIPRFVRVYFPFFSHYQKLYMNNLISLQKRIIDKIKKRRKEIEQISEEEMVGDDMLDILLTTNTPRDPHGWENDDTQEPLTDVEIRDIIMDLIVAGSDTVFIFSRFL